jgi:hypothetical protein
MRKIIMSLALFTGVALFTVAPGQSQSAPVKNLRDCDGTYSGTFRNVTVQAGGSCILSPGAEVIGGVHAMPGAANLIVHTDVGRNIQAQGVTGTVLIGPRGCKFDPIVGNNVHVNASHNVLICSVTTKNNILVTDNDGRISVRDSVAGNNIHVDRNRAWVKDGSVGHNRPGAIRLLRDTAGNHIHVFHNDDSRILILKGNSPEPIVK